MSTATLSELQALPDFAKYCTDDVYCFGDVQVFDARNVVNGLFGLEIDGAPKELEMLVQLVELSDPAMNRLRFRAIEVETLLVTRWVLENLNRAVRLNFVTYGKQGQETSRVTKTMKVVKVVPTDGIRSPDHSIGAWSVLLESE